MSFQNVASAYKLLSSPSRLKLEVPPLAEWLGDAEKSLDLGCGTGDHIAELKKLYGLSISGIDVDPGMIAEGKKRHPDLDLAVGDLKAPPKGGWDALLCLGNCISCLPAGTDWVGIFQNWKEAAREGARCYIQWMLPRPNSGENKVVRSEGPLTMTKSLIRDGDVCHLDIQVHEEGEDGEALVHEHKQLLQCLSPQTIITALYQAGWREIQRMPLAKDQNPDTVIIAATRLFTL